MSDSVCTRISATSMEKKDEREKVRRAAGLSISLRSGDEGQALVETALVRDLPQHVATEVYEAACGQIDRRRGAGRCHSRQVESAIPG